MLASAAVIADGWPIGLLPGAHIWQAPLTCLASRRWPRPRRSPGYTRRLAGQADHTAQCARDKLWVPETSSTSCDQVIFVDQTSDASLSSDVVLLKIDRFGKWHQRGSAVQ